MRHREETICTVCVVWASFWLFVPVSLLNPSVSRRASQGGIDNSNNPRRVEMNAKHTRSPNLSMRTRRESQLLALVLLLPFLVAVSEVMLVFLVLNLLFDGWP